MPPMTSGGDAFTWIYTQGLEPWNIMADQFAQMANPNVIIKAATSAGQIFKTSVQDLIYSQPSLAPYAGVAERITVWSDDAGVYVGVPAGDEALPVAQEMDTVFPVLDTVASQEAQTGRLGQEFESSLIDQVF